MDQSIAAADRAAHRHEAQNHRGRLAALWAHRWTFLAAVVAVAFGALMTLRWLIGPEVVVYPAVGADLVKTVVASGHVETPFRVEVASQITGIVDEVLVAEGETVKRGQPLVVIEKSELQAAAIQAEAALAQAEARLRQLRELTRPAAEEALKQARATLTNAEAAFERADQLARSGYGTRSTLDEATKNLDVARTQVRTAELQVFTSGPGGSDYVLAETQVNQARASLATARARLAYATVVAPRDGVLIARSVERGTVAQPGRTLFVLAPAGDVQLVLQIDEKNIGLLRLGQEAVAAADAYPDRRFRATVAFINPAVDIQRASIEVKLKVIDPPAELRQDMTVSVDIEVDRRADTVVVPARVLNEPNSAAPFVLVVENGRARLRTVRLGLRAGDKAEILDGVKPGELLVPVAAGIRVGQRLRPVKP